MKYEYKKIGSVQPEVKIAIDRFRNLPDKEKRKQNLLQWLIGGSTQPYKVSQKDSKYTNVSKKSQTCGNCKYLYLEWYTKKFICSEIQDAVHVQGWCDRWEGSLKKARPDILRYSEWQKNLLKNVDMR